LVDKSVLQNARLVNSGQKGRCRARRIVAGLERKRAPRRDKALVANKGFSLKMPEGGGGFVIDRAKIEADARFEGLFALRTNTKIAALQVVLRLSQSARGCNRRRAAAARTMTAHDRTHTPHPLQGLDGGASRRSLAPGRGERGHATVASAEQLRGVPVGGQRKYLA
jgi:hypothetical protein